MRGWQANERHTCVLPVVLGLCPKLKYPLLCRGIIIILKCDKSVTFRKDLRKNSLVGYDHNA